MNGADAWGGHGWIAFEVTGFGYDTYSLTLEPGGVLALYGAHGNGPPIKVAYSSNPPGDTSLPYFAQMGTDGQLYIYQGSYLSEPTAVWVSPDMTNPNTGFTKV